jgi:Spy/CpxP family protein refolding chaperone
MVKTAAVMSFFFAVVTASAYAESPYRGEDTRDIKSLSEAQIGRYLSGDGMGLAKAAELNHYPGPRHVLELSDELRLTEVQRRRTEELFAGMRSRAIDLGKRILEKERDLERLFVEGSADAGRLREILLEIGALQAELRYVHLSAHLEQKQLLTNHQIMMYDNLRGYGSGSHGSHDHSH